MKTAISVPDDVFRKAERLAKRLGISRSELFTRAVSMLVDESEGRDITASYDRAFAAPADEESHELRRRSARRVLGDVEW